MLAVDALNLQASAANSSNPKLRIRFDFLVRISFSPSFDICHPFGGSERIGLRFWVLCVYSMLAWAFGGAFRRGK